VDWIVTAEQLRSELPQVRLVDVREPEENVEARIEGGTLIPMDELSARAPRELKEDDDIVLYCAHGVRSLQALMALKQLGFERVRSLEGGIAAWIEAGGPVKSGKE
jgi:rhodanese-related sulfurtransferase